MDFLRNLFAPGPKVPSQNRQEVDQLIQELIQIGKKDDFLSEHAGGAFNGHFHHIRARAIGKRLNEIGGLPLMEYARDRVKRKLGLNMAAHLEYAWSEIGSWVP
jgi:hypothetical protein